MFCCTKQTQLTISNGWRWRPTSDQIGWWQLMCGTFLFDQFQPNITTVHNNSRHFVVSFFLFCFLCLCVYVFVYKLSSLQYFRHLIWCQTSQFIFRIVTIFIWNNVPSSKRRKKKKENVDFTLENVRRRVYSLLPEQDETENKHLQKRQTIKTSHTTTKKKKIIIYTQSNFKMF